MYGPGWRPTGLPAPPLRQRIRADRGHRLRHSQRPLTERGARLPSARRWRGLRRTCWTAALRLVPFGTVGELCLSGPGLPRYLGRPISTATRFVADPYGPPGARLYRTGDLVRWRRTGPCEFLGRPTARSRSRSAHRAGRDRVRAGRVPGPCAVLPPLLDEPRPGLKRLLAHVVPEGPDGPDGPGVAPADVTDFLEQRLPRHMVPSAVAVLHALPLTPSGKLDRAALPPVPYAETGSAAGSRRPCTGREEILRRLFGEVLVLDQGRFGVDDSFFALGGDSIMALQLVARAREHGIVLTNQQIFACRTVAELARTAKESDASASARPAAFGAAPADRAECPAPLPDAETARLEAEHPARTRLSSR